MIKIILIISVTVMFLTNDKDLLRPRTRGGPSKETQVIND